MRIAVGQIADYTGKAEADGSGRKVTAGAALMAMSALNKAGVHMVERFDTSVAEMELKYANNKLIGDDQHPNPQTGDFRKIMAGSIPGLRLLHRRRHHRAELQHPQRKCQRHRRRHRAPTPPPAPLGGSLYVMNVGLDMRLVNTNTLEVADVISYQKQIIGRQISAGVFDFLGTNFFDVSVGESALEPIQLAVRSVIERATLEMITRIYRAPGRVPAPSRWAPATIRCATPATIIRKSLMRATAALCAAALCAAAGLLRAAALSDELWRCRPRQPLSRLLRQRSRTDQSARRSLTPTHIRRSLTMKYFKIFSPLPSWP